MIQGILRSKVRLALLGVCVAGVVCAAGPAHLAAQAVNAPPLSELWDAPVHVANADLLNGPWGAAHAPDPADRYTFLRPKKGGVNPGVIVRDSRGRVWHVKQPPRNSQGAEGPVEVVLSRVLSAVGYHQPPVYFLPSFTLADNSGTHVKPGGRFRLDDPSMMPKGEWQWRRNPFVNTRPYKGLLVILLVFNSWDLKDSNNTIYEVPDGARGSGLATRWFVVRDLGAALGETGRMAPKRNNIERFERQTFIKGVSGGFVEFVYSGWQPSLVRHAITVDDVRWATGLLGGLSDRQWRDAFRAGGYPDDLGERFIRKIKANIQAGQQLASPDGRVAERRP